MLGVEKVEDQKCWLSSNCRRVAVRSSAPVAETRVAVAGWLVGWLVAGKGQGNDNGKRHGWNDSMIDTANTATMDKDDI